MISALIKGVIIMSIFAYTANSNFQGLSCEIPVFVLETEKMTYAFEVLNGYVNNVYWGEKLKNSKDLLVGRYVSTTNHSYSARDRQREEYPAFGGRFYDNECLKVTFPDGVRDTILKYVDYEIDEEELVLKINLKDEVYPFGVQLVYKIYDGLDLIDRHTVITNFGTEDIKLDTFYSANWVLPWVEKQRLTYMGSAWGHEGEIKQTDIGLDTIILQSRAGVSCAKNIPYFAIDDYTATEHSGQVWFGTIQWSANWQMHIYRDINRSVRVNGGISNFDCDLILESGESFETPVFTGGFVNEGFGAANRQFHDYIRKTNKSNFVNEVMPVLYNAWSTFLFDVSEKLILEQAKHFADLGVEMLVIDDGWFKGRKKDTAGLGDWVPDPEKFPNGLKPVVDHINKLGIRFGIWVEPEMINPDSDLYREHPDWVMNYPTREREEQRHQLTLNLAREDVFEFTRDWLDKLLSSANIEHLKWDMNRFFSQAGWPEAKTKEQKSIYIKYAQNFQRLLRFINEKYPHVLIENCASGGLRGDLATTQWCSRINRSDNQDTIDILQMHEGFVKINLTKMAGGGCHFHHAPYYLTGRNAPMKRMALTAMNGSLSVGLDLRRLNEEEIKELKGYIDYYKKIRKIVQLGDMYILNSAYDKNSKFIAYQYVSKDKKDSIILVYANNVGYFSSIPSIMPKGLDPDMTYSVDFVWNQRLSNPYPDTTGDGLMKFGVYTSDTHVFQDDVFDCFAIEIKAK